jgi:antitoxin MazE
MNNAVIAKWGNSLALRIPHALANQLNLTENSKVNISCIDGRMVITRGITLEEMLSSLTEDNRNVLDDLGAPVGREDFI